MEDNKTKIIMVDTYNILPCPYQTRTSFDTNKIQQLISSIKENGILQPLTATQCGTGYQLIAGHRRLIAAKVLKMETVPVIVLQKTEQEIAVLCTIENLHREDLNFFEQAQAIQILIDQLGLTQAQAGQKLALTQGAIANKLKLLQFSAPQQEQMLKAGLTERHARAVARIDKEKQQAVINYIIKNNLNVCQADRYIEQLLNKQPQHKQKTLIHIKDVRLFTNTITKAVSIMKMAGFDTQYQQIEKEDGIEYRILIPYNKKQAEAPLAQACAATAPQAVNI